MVDVARPENTSKGKINTLNRDGTNETRSLTAPIIALKLP